MMRQLRGRQFRHDDYCMCRKCSKKKGAVLDYFSYIESDLWKKRKADYFGKYRKQCRACGSLKEVELHHMKYGMFGKEPDYCLIALCRGCHTEFHQQHRMTYDMIRETLLYCEDKQKLLKTALRDLTQS